MANIFNRPKTLPPTLVGVGLLLMSVYQLTQREFKEAIVIGSLGISLLAFLEAVDPLKQDEWKGKIAVWIALTGIVIMLGVTFLA